jgi:hypothetical protein
MGFYCLFLLFFLGQFDKVISYAEEMKEDYKTDYIKLLKGFILLYDILFY